MNNKNRNDGSNAVPVGVITGFLGSGKTTLLNRLIRHPGMSDAALIVNEFGEIGIDHELVDSAFENTVLMDSGCICCSIRGDLTDTIGDLFAKVAAGQLPAFSKILIETTGLADPAPIIHTLGGSDDITARCRLQAVVTLVDGQLGLAQLSEQPEAASQIAAADVALISKADLAGGAAIRALTARIDSLNPGLPVLTVTRGEIDPDLLFETARLSETRIADAPPAGGGHGHEHHRHGNAPDHRHDGVQAVSLEVEHPLSWDRLRLFLETVFSLRGSAFLRVKGIVFVDGREKPLVIQAVGNAFSEPRILDRGQTGNGVSRLVMITRGLDSAALRDSFRALVLDGDPTGAFQAASPSTDRPSSLVPDLSRPNTASRPRRK